MGAGPAFAVHPGSEDDDIQSHDEEEGIGTEAPDSEEAPREDSVTYSGIGLSRVSTIYDNLEPAVNLDLQIGLRVPTVMWISAEINLSFTVIPGENKTANSGSSSPFGTTCDPLEESLGLCTPSANQGEETQTRSRNDLQMNNVGVFAVLRSPGKFYAMGKYGYRYINSSIEEIQDGDDQSGDAWAVGGGWRWSKGLSGIEVLYSEYSSQLEYYGFNIAYGFGGRRDNR